MLAGTDLVRAWSGGWQRLGPIGRLTGGAYGSISLGQYGAPTNIRANTRPICKMAEKGEEREGGLERWKIRFKMGVTRRVGRRALELCDGAGWGWALAVSVSYMGWSQGGLRRRVSSHDGGRIPGPVRGAVQDATD